MGEPPDLSVQPTADQRERFRALSPSERYRWLAGMLRTTHGLASPEAKERWRALKQAQSGGFLSVLSGFASALEQGAFDEAARHLSPACIYDTGTSILKGGAVIEAYLTRRARLGTALVRVRSRVEAAAPGVAIVTFDEDLRAQDLTHRHRVRQEITVGHARLIEAIVEREVEGEASALAAFLSASGASGAP